MYDGWMLLHVGLGLATRSPWVLASVPAVWLLRRREVPREEHRLAAQFGDDSAAYSDRVPGSLLERVEPGLAAFRRLFIGSCGQTKASLPPGRLEEFLQRRR